MIVLGLGYLMIYGQLHKKIQSNANDNKCNYSTANQAVFDLKYNSFYTYKLIQNIKSYKNYQSDSNCLYILTAYYINISANTLATKYFKLLQANIVNHPLNQVLLNYMSIKQLKNNLNAVNQHAQQIQAGTTYIESPTQSN